MDTGLLWSINILDGICGHTYWNMYIHVIDKLVNNKHIHIYTLRTSHKRELFHNKIVNCISAVMISRFKSVNIPFQLVWEGPGIYI
jgi:hypothetical protein